MKKHFIWLCFALIFGQNTATDFAEILAIAKHNNPQILAANAKIAASEEQMKIAGVLPDPQISAGYFIEPIQTRTGPQEFRLGLMQKLPWFGKPPLQKKIAALQHNIAVLQSRKMELSLESAMLKTIFDIQFFEETAQILDENLMLISQMEQVVQTMYSTGKSHHSDIVRIAIERENLQNQIRKTTDEKAVKWADFEILVGEKITNLPTNLPGFSEFESFENNPDFQMAELEKSIAEIQIKLAKLGFFPDVAVGADWIFTDGDDNPLVAKIGLNLPIHFRKNSAKKQQSEQILVMKMQNQLAIFDQLQSQKNRLENDVSNAEIDRNLLKNTLIPLAEEHLSVSEQGFLAGEISFSDYLDAQWRIFDLQLKFAKSERDLKKATAQFQELMGFFNKAIHDLNRGLQKTGENK